MITSIQRLNVRKLLKSVFVPQDPSKSTFDSTKYIKHRLEPQLIFERPSDAPQLELHLGTISQTEEFLYGKEVEPEIIPDKTFPEVWLKVRIPGIVHEKYIISNILGDTRLRHFLAMLKLSCFPEENLSVFDFQNDYEQLSTSFWPAEFKKCQTAIFAFNPQIITDVLTNKVQLSKKTQKNDFLEFISLTGINNYNILVFNLQYVYGLQIIPVLRALLRLSTNLDKIIFIGACGGIDERLRLGDFVCFRQLYNFNGKRVIPAVINALPAETLPFLAYNLDVISVQTLFSETSDRVKRWRSKNIGAVDLELFHIAFALSKFQGVKFGAILKVSDLPGRKEFALESFKNSSYLNSQNNFDLNDFIGDYVAA